MMEMIAGLLRDAVDAPILRLSTVVGRY